MQKQQGNMQVFFPYAILLFQQSFYRSQIGEIQQRKKELLFCSVEEWSEIV